MNYEDFLPIYPDLEDPILQQKILNKEEFYQLRLKKDIEIIPKGDLLNHQKIIQRFLSPYTPYDELLLYHATGTGKTGVAFGMTEKLLTNPESGFRRVYVLTRGPDLLDSHLRQLVFSFSDRFNVPENIKPENLTRYMRRLVGSNYRFQTFGQFVSEIENVPDEFIINNYSNSIFILDEIHSIRADTDAKIYKTLFRLLHLAKNRRVLLMSATPMKDSVTELAWVMNLILPENQQLPTGKAFEETFIQGDSIINQDRLKTFLKGRLSFLSYTSSTIQTRYMGTSINLPNIEQFRLFTTMMSPIQKKGYIESFLKDTKGEESSVYANSRQSSLFVFPDGSWGVEGLKKYGTINKDQLTLSPTFKNEVNTIDKLSKYSSKYSFIIQNILDNPNKLIYIYCSMVHGSGINLFAKILELYGFTQARGVEKNEGKRYILLTSETSSISRSLSFFNSRRNSTGKFCQIVLGSKKISEGFTFKNIQIVHISTLFWNYTETQQAIARAVRYRSHTDLIQAGIIPVVQIYQHGVILDDKQVQSVDVLMINLSKEKDILIRKMDRMIKEISFDCPLTFERNYRNETDNSRACDYSACDYKCDESGLEPTTLDVSTYQLYYQSNENIINGIRDLFSIQFTMKLSTLSDLLKIDLFPLLKALDFMITYNLPITNKFGIVSYLREENNTYYLVDNIILENNQFNLNYYTQSPMIIQKKSLNHLIQQNRFQQTIKTIQSLSQAIDQKQIETLLSVMPVETQEMLLEYILEKKYISKKVIPLTNWFENIYQNFLKQHKKFKIVSTLLASVNRCLDSEQKEWIDCPPDEEKAQVELQTMIDLEDISKNNYGYYGILEGEKFCIKDIRPTQQKDKRFKRTGSNCMEVGFKKPRLAEICLDLGIEIKDKENIDLEARSSISRTKGGQALLETWKDWDDEKFAKGVYWYKKTQKALCHAIKTFFQEKGLIIDGPCGKAGKAK
jgi:hypothetical protein